MKFNFDRIDKVRAVETLRVHSKIMSGRFLKIAVGGTVIFNALLILTSFLAANDLNLLFAYGAIQMLVCLIVLVVMIYSGVKFLRVIKDAATT